MGDTTDYKMDDLRVRVEKLDEWRARIDEELKTFFASQWSDLRQQIAAMVTEDRILHSELQTTLSDIKSVLREEHQRIREVEHRISTLEHATERGFDQLKIKFLAVVAAVALAAAGAGAHLPKLLGI